jgi:hypothetical protein
LNLLDENFPEDQLALLKEWRIPFAKSDVTSSRGIKDADIIPLLHQHSRVTFFTQDKDFFRPALCHASYCLVWLDVGADDAALYVRRLLRHPHFATQAKRMGTVIRAHHDKIHFWQRNRRSIRRAEW